MKIDKKIILFINKYSFWINKKFEIYNLEISLIIITILFNFLEVINIAFFINFIIFWKIIFHFLKK